MEYFSQNITMAQLFRRTKKCCAKILRKLSFASDSPCSSSANTNTNNNNYHRNKSRIAPSPYRSSKYGFNQSTDTCSTLDDLSYDEEYFNHSININNNVCSENKNVKKYFRIHHKTENHKNMLTTTSADNNNQRTINKSIFGNDDNIIFTENKIYIGLNTQQYNQKHHQHCMNSGSSTSNYCSKANVDCSDENGNDDGRMIMSLPTTSNHCNYNDGDEGNKKVVCKQTFDLSLSATIVSNKKASTTASDITNSNAAVVAAAASAVVAEMEKHNLTTTNFGGTITPTKCSRKLNFNEKHRQHVKTTASNSSCNYNRSNDENEVIFEKVKYDKTKKYLRTSPSHSNGSFPVTPLKQYYHNNITLNNDKHYQSSDNCNARLSIYDNYHPTNNIDEKSSTASSSFICARKKFSNIKSRQYEKIESLNPWDDDNDIDNDNNDNKMIAVDDFIMNEKYDPWHFLDHPNFLHKSLTSSLSDGKCKSSSASSKGHSVNSGIHYEYVGSSSRRTSVSTIETWIDDEIFDNSFNEELEKRCSSVFER